MIALVLAMAWARRGQTLIVALLALFGVAAAVAAPAYLRAADRAVADGQVRTAQPRELAISVRATQGDARGTPQGSDPTGPDLDRNGSVLLGLPGFDYVHSVEYPTLGIEPTNIYSTRFVHRQGVCEHLAMTAGRCLMGESDVIIGEHTARRLKLAPGDGIDLAFAKWINPDFDPPPRYVPDGEAKRLLVAGVYRVPRPDDMYWGSHGYFAPAPGNRPGEPVFATNATVNAMDRGAVEAGLDAYARPGALAVDRLPAVRAGLASIEAAVPSLGAGVELRSELPLLLARVDAGRAAAHRIVPVLAVALVLLACLTIFLVVGYGTEGRRPELAVVALRGARWGQRWWLATGENVLAIVAGALVGCLAGQLLVNAFTAWRFPGVGADPGLDALRWAPAAAGAAVLTALVAERRQIATPVADLLRRAPAVPGSARAIAAEVVVVLLAVAAGLQLASTGGTLRGVGTFAAALILLAAGLVAARLLLPWATVLGRRQLRRGRLGGALAGFQLSRRPGAVRLFALLTAAVAVTGYAACAIDVAARGRADQAIIGTGAPRVVTLGAAGRQELLAAVRAVDPDGTFAMPVVRVGNHPGSPPLLAVDSTRLAAVAAWSSGGPAPGAVAAALHPAAGPRVEVHGERIDFDITADFPPGKAVDVQAVLSPMAGGPDAVLTLGVLRDGRHRYPDRVPACARGCTLNSLRIAGGQGTLDVAGTLTVHALGGGAPGDGVPGTVLTDPARWRTTEGGRVGTAADGLRIEVTSLNGLPSGMWVQPAAAPYPLPVATAGVPALRSIGGLDARDVPVSVVAELAAVPGQGSPAALVDLDYADRLATDGARSSDVQVWLNDRAPADVLRRLEAHGLAVTGDVRSDQVRERLDRQGPAIALWFYGIVGVLAVALAAGALVLAAAVDRPRRVEDLSALRGQGLSRRALRRATLWTYPVLVVIAVVAGAGAAALGWWLTGWALPLAGLDRTPIPLPGWPRPLTLPLTALGVALILAGVAALAGRRTLRLIR